MSNIDPRELRDTCGKFGTGVTVITTRHDGQDHGMTANAFMSVSLDPPLIAVSVAENAKLLDKIRNAGNFAVSILGEDMEDIAWHFAGKTNPRLQALFKYSDHIPVVQDALAAMVATVEKEIVAGDHTIFVGHVRKIESHNNKNPLMFFKGRITSITAQEPRLVLENLEQEMIW